jgi:hypothetical protein
MTAVSTAYFSRKSQDFKKGEDMFYFTCTILGGRDAIKEYVAASIWSLSFRWQPKKIVYLSVDWVPCKVPFPRFDLRLSEGQSLDDFIFLVEELVVVMVGKFYLSEYKQFKNIVKHKHRVNRVFVELARTLLYTRGLLVQRS